MTAAARELLGCSRADSRKGAMEDRTHSNRARGEDVETPLVLDPEMLRVKQLLEDIAPSPLPVLLHGETGSGKEVAAEWVHASSGLARDRFVRVNCASLSETLIESELFGHERGAFTGAHTARRGLFEEADGGTLLLDEVAELSYGAQAKLLRVLERNEIVRVGATRPRPVNVRVVAATHRELRAMVSEGRFRQDLYFRLDAITVHIPPLRERPSEIIPLATRFVARLMRRMNRPVPGLSGEAARLLERHAWPGNVRELRHTMERAAVLCREAVIEPEHLVLHTAATPPSSRPTAPSSRPPVPEDAMPLAPALTLPIGHPRAAAPSAASPVEMPERDIREQVRHFEKERILAALRETGGNQTRAAELLGVSRRTLTNKLGAHGIDRPRRRNREVEPDADGKASLDLAPTPEGLRH